MSECQGGEHFVKRYHVMFGQIPICRVAYKEALHKVSGVKMKVEENQQVIRM